MKYFCLSAIVWIACVLFSTVAFAGAFPDRNLSDCINQHVEKESLGGAGELTVLSCAALNISSLQGLETLDKLEVLVLEENDIVNITPLAGLENLKKLKLGNNRIKDISPLSNLTNLWYLDLHTIQTPVDIAKLNGLVNLKELWLWGNRIVNLVEIGRFQKLERLHLAHTGLVDLTFLAGMSDPDSLKKLWLSGNEILDISVLRYLRNLEAVHLDSNLVTDLSPLMDLKNLKFVDLRRAVQLIDISPLYEIGTLTTVNLYGSDNIPCQQLSWFDKSRPDTLVIRPGRCVDSEIMVIAFFDRGGTGEL